MELTSPLGKSSRNRYVVVFDHWSLVDKYRSTKIFRFHSSVNLCEEFITSEFLSFCCICVKAD